MTLDQIDGILDCETKCVLRADLGTCSHNCETCDLVLQARDILLAYIICRLLIRQAQEDNLVIDFERIMSEYEEMFDKWGISKRQTGPSTQT